MGNFIVFDEVITCSNENSCKTRDFCINLVNNARTIICVWKLNGTLIKFNNYAEKITGFTEKEVLGEKWKNTIVDITLESETIKFFDKLLNKDPFYDSDLASKFICKNGSYIDILWSNYFMYDKKGDPEFIVGMGMNITVQKRDELTNLSNRTSITNKTSLEMLKVKHVGKKLALLYMDLDNFKVINDTLGHSAGNTLLKEIGSRLQNVIFDSKNVARLGGDEFAVLFPYKDSIEEVKAFANKIINVVNQPVMIAEKELYITASIGIAIYTEHGSNFEELTKNADTAMYNAKELGRNRYCFFTKELNDRVIEKSELVSSIRHAIKNNEFRVFYQPQISLKTGAISGMEALVRWFHPKKGMISPYKFIPLAEDSDLIIPIGNIVLYEACRQNKQWQDLGYAPLRVAVNLSAKQFEQEDLVETIEKVLEETSLEPKWLELEITESIVMKDFDFSIKMLNRLRKMGIHVSLDDFGTGYSSLNYLKRLPIDTVKIDKTFVDNIRLDIKDEIIAKAVIELAHNMGLEVVAEGVEYVEQFNFLKEQECDKVQGFLFSKPVPPEKFEQSLERFSLSTEIIKEQFRFA
jgi:diguanylate cyclase (GGDEF)-like protein/PAS domain S-box-containing protein